jgi:hypothetical protein
MPRTAKPASYNGDAKVEGFAVMFSAVAAMSGRMVSWYVSS